MGDGESGRQERGTAFNPPEVRCRKKRVLRFAQSDKSVSVLTSVPVLSGDHGVDTLACGSMEYLRKASASARLMKLERSLLKTLPKVLLHEHLDGVLRPRTVIDLADSVKYSGLPTRDSQALAEWFHQGANKGSLAKYLEGFAHTIAVMQTEEALERVAYEQVEDLRTD